eukprot:4497046-Prymnesium_polylepis.1
MSLGCGYPVTLMRSHTHEGGSRATLHAKFDHVTLDPKGPQCGLATSAPFSTTVHALALRGLQGRN